MAFTAKKKVTSHTNAWGNSNRLVASKKNVTEYLRFKETVIDNQSSEKIAIVDLMNLWRCRISDRPDAKYNSAEEIIESINDLAKQLRRLNDFKTIYLVTKSFKLNDVITYVDFPKIVLWCFCTAVPEWREKVCLVLANGEVDNDKTIDDRGCIILCGELMSQEHGAMIVSNDHYDDFIDSRFKKVILSFYWIKNNGESWNDIQLILRQQRSFVFKSSFTEYEFRVIRPGSLKSN